MDQVPEEHLTKHQRRLRHKQEKEADRNRTNTSRKIKRVSLWALVILLIGGGIGWLVWQAASHSPTPESDIVSRNGLHWHPQLTITVKGKEETIPQNIGLGAVHGPIHTHEDLPTIHLEMQGRVTKNDIRLGQFFKAWGKQFSATCLLDSCNGTDGRLTMTVNGQPNTEFDQYMMQDKDKIELQFE